MGQRASRIKYKSSRLEHKLSLKVSDMVHCSQGVERASELKMRLSGKKSKKKKSNNNNNDGSSGSSTTTNSHNNNHGDLNENGATTKRREFDLQLLVSQTHFSPVELKILKVYYSSFCSDQDHMYATRNDCKQFFYRQELLTQGFQFTQEHEYLLNALFNAINTDGGDLLSFSELAIAMSCAIHGTFEERASLSFRLYDTDGNGVLNREELKSYILSLNRIGVLKLETKLQRCRTRGDLEEQELQFMRSRSTVNIIHRSETSFRLATTENEQSEMPRVSSSADTEHQSDNNAPSLEGASTSTTLPTVTTEEEVFNPSRDSDDYCLLLSEQQIDFLVDRFFGGSTELSYQQYLERSCMDKYLTEGLGIYDHMFLPMVRVVETFLESPDRYEKSTMLVCNSRLYWVEIKGGRIYHHDPVKRVMKRVVHIDKIEGITFESREVFILKISGSYIRYKAIDDEQARNCVLCILLHFVSQIDNRYDSFSPVRSEKCCKFSPLIDGEETYATMAKAMLAAKEQIFIAGWCVNPFIYLIRDDKVPNLATYRLDQILLTMAQKGVQIFIIIWHEVTMAGMNLSTNKIRMLLTDMSPNIHCIVHPRNLPFSWSHHQKICVVDQVVAFVGGLDVGTGRWDNYKHEIVDNNHIHTMWPGSDYCNETLAIAHKSLPMRTKVDAFRDALDRDMYPRLPWHDIHCVLVGSVASDIASNFCGRWNHHNRRVSQDVRDAMANAGEVGYYTITLDLRPYNPDHPLKVAAEYLPGNISLSSVRAQALRSISTWSGSLRTEQSIQTAYIDVIRNSQHYIYIENQYFISHTNLSHKVQNRIAEAIIERVGRAIQNKEVFRVLIILPVHHCGDIYEPSTHQVIKWQRRTIDGVFATLQQLYPESNIDNYISFFALANYGFIFNMPHFSQIYVHAKLLLVDDRIAIIGSANINDRSMVGNHDSEIAVMVEDSSNTATTMNGKIVRTGKTLKKLRKKLWREHFLGDPNVHVIPLDLTTLAQEGRIAHIREDGKIKGKDPISDSTYARIKKRARDNSEIYQRVFPHYPSQRHATLAEYKHDFELYTHSVRSRTPLVDEKTIQLLHGIKGQLVDYPREWLRHDPLKKDRKLMIVDENIFY